MTDFAADVRTHGDRFAGEGPLASDEALPGRSHSDVTTTVGQDGRVLLAPHGDPPLDADLLLAAYVAPLVGGGSVVLCRHPDLSALGRRRTAERAS